MRDEEEEEFAVCMLLMTISFLFTILKFIFHISKGNNEQ